jgi:hypothetical protein
LSPDGHGLNASPGKSRYPAGLMAFERLRVRRPCVALVLLLIIALLFLGLACVCATHHPTTPTDRVTSVISTAPPVIALWSAAGLGLILITTLVLGEGVRPRRSLASLQRFLL